MEARVIRHVKEFCEKLKLEVLIDTVGNVLIRKRATKGYEDRKGVILQCHLDMVAQKEPEKQFDFENDPIEMVRVVDWVKANGTTLGADNGIGIAAALSILESEKIEHGPLEVLLTVNEEDGMTGAFNLNPGWLRGEILINLDSEEEGSLFIGCGSGMDATVKIGFEKEPIPEKYKALHIAVSGLSGGHSGLDIGLYKGNANKLLNRCLWLTALENGIKISTITGGDSRSAIPREASAIIVFHEDEEVGVLGNLKKMEIIFRKEFENIDPGLFVSVSATSLPEYVIDSGTQKKLLNVIQASPNDVIRMSNIMTSLVETSSSLARIKSTDTEVEILWMLRSSLKSSMEALKYQYTSLLELIEVDLILEEIFPSWEINTKSQILSLMKDLYFEHFGCFPETKALHGGIECGIIGNIYPDLDMISIGPTIRFPHSPDEQVNIESVRKFWNFLLVVLKEIPQKP